MSERRVALVVTAVAGAALAVLAAVLVPWSPVPGGIPDPATARSVFSAEQVARAEAFSHAARLWSWGSSAASLTIACVLGLTPAGRRLLARLPGARRGRWWVRVVVAVAVLEIVGRLLTLPFAVLLRRDVLAYGLSHQGWGDFATDLLRGQLVAIVTTSLLVLVLVGCARRWPRAWTAAVGASMAVLVLVGSFAYPLLVEPLFNDFTPLSAGPLRTGVLALAAREGVDVDEVLVADASRRTTTLNAYVSGFGSTRRVVLYDTLVADVPTDEALSVVAHELAHARHDDVLAGSLLGGAGAAVGVGLLGLVLHALRRRGHPAPADPAVVPLVLALLAVGTVLSLPAQNAVSRRIETRADVDALVATHDPAAFVAVQRRLGIRALADPTPPAWAQWWFGSHPTGLTRIAVARQMERADRAAQPR